MDFDDVTDGQTTLTFTPEVGVEIGEPAVLALSGEPMMLCFEGTCEEQPDIFNRWDQLAQENDHPAIFDREGLRPHWLCCGLRRHPAPGLQRNARGSLAEARCRRSNIIRRHC